MSGVLGKHDTHAYHLKLVEYYGPPLVIQSKFAPQ
jgi:hypothetical protein